MEGNENPLQSAISTADYPVTIVHGTEQDLHVVHVVTMGDMLIGLLISILIFVVLLSRLLGRSARW